MTAEICAACNATMDWRGEPEPEDPLCCDCQSDEYERDIAHLREQVRQLREALEPFANMWATGVECRMSDLRRAHAALASTEETELDNARCQECGRVTVATLAYGSWKCGRCIKAIEGET